MGWRTARAWWRWLTQGPRTDAGPRQGLPRKSGQRRERPGSAAPWTVSALPATIERMTETGRATELLRRMGTGDEAAAEEITLLLHAELRRIAQGVLQGAGPGHTLQPTALLNEVWIRLFRTDSISWENRTHFLSTAAVAMRSVLVDHARKRRAAKRGGDLERVPLDAVVVLFEQNATDLLALEECLEALGTVDPELVKIVELRFFSGLNHPEIAQVLGIPLRTVERGWKTARTWLYQRLVDGES